MQEIRRGKFFPLGSIENGCKRCIENLGACLTSAAVFRLSQWLLTNNLDLEDVYLVAFGDMRINKEGCMSLYALQITQQHFAKSREKWKSSRAEIKVPNAPTATPGSIEATPAPAPPVAPTDSPGRTSVPEDAK